MKKKQGCHWTNLGYRTIDRKRITERVTEFLANTYITIYRTDIEIYRKYKELPIDLQNHLQNKFGDLKNFFWPSSFLLAILNKQQCNNFTIHVPVWSITIPSEHLDQAWQTNKRIVNHGEFDFSGTEACSTVLGKPHPKKKRKSSDNVTRGGWVRASQGYTFFKKEIAATVFWVPFGP